MKTVTLFSGSHKKLGAVFAVAAVLLLSAQAAFADGLTATGDTLPIGANNQTVLTITGSSKFAAFAGSASFAGSNTITNNLAVGGGTSLGGDAWLGSSDAGGDTWNSGVWQAGPALHFSSSTGWNSDDIYLQRWNVAHDQSALALVIGDNAAADVGAGGDVFVIGALDSSNNNAWIQRFTFTSNGRLGIGTANPQAALDVNGRINSSEYIQIGGLVTEGAACSPNGLLGRDSDGAIFDCQDGTWGRPQTFTSVNTTAGAISANCVIGDPTNPPNYNQLQYNTTCGSRYCKRVLHYGFGMITENGPGYSMSAPFYSDPNTFIEVDCSR